MSNWSDKEVKGDEVGCSFGRDWREKPRYCWSLWRLAGMRMSTSNAEAMVDCREIVNWLGVVCYYKRSVYVYQGHKKISQFNSQSTFQLLTTAFCIWLWALRGDRRNEMSVTSGWNEFPDKDSGLRDWFICTGIHWGRKQLRLFAGASKSGWEIWVESFPDTLKKRTRSRPRTSWNDYSVYYVTWEQSRMPRRSWKSWRACTPGT